MSNGGTMEQVEKKGDRSFVLQVMPQARYLNLSSVSNGHNHCIDDDYNDRYLAFGAPSRAAAWREAKKFLERRIAEGKLATKGCAGITGRDDE